ACAQALGHMLDMVCFTSSMGAMNDVLFHLLVPSFCPSVPPLSAERLLLIPKQGHFPRIVSRLIVRGSPGEHRGIFFMQCLRRWKIGFNARICLADMLKIFRMLIMLVAVGMLH